VKEIAAGKTNYKTLQVDTGLESYINAETGEMGAEYLKYYDLFEYFNKDAEKTLLIGGAAYTYPIHYLGKYNKKTIDVVEIDDKMTQIAEKEFGLNINEPRLKIYTQDGRSFLNYNENKYDTILIDAFKGVNAPFELTTYEALVNARNMLNENGMVLTNIISSIEGKDSEFIKYEYATYKVVFDDVKLFQVRNREKEENQNLILVGIKGEPIKDDNKYSFYNKYLENEITEFYTDKKVVTDDFAPIGN
jgi:spermidine synthase